MIRIGATLAAMLLISCVHAHGMSDPGASAGSATERVAGSATERVECPAIEKGKDQADGPAVDTTHPWYGARVGIIGDSISDPRVADGPEKYDGCMAREIGIIPCVGATNGREWNDVIRQANNLKSEYGDDIDAILILMGTNDFNSGVPIGEWFTEEYVQVEAANGEPKSMQTRRHRTPNFDQNTFKGRINMALDSLRNMYPDKQIILMTPLHRGLARLGERNIQPDENFTNRCGEYVDAYVNAVKEAENIWAVPVIDLNAISGLFPLSDSQKEYFLRDRDKLHPSDEGHERIAHALIAWLRCLAPGFQSE